MMRKIHPSASVPYEVARAGFGVFYLAMVVVNLAVTLPGAQEFYPSIARISWPGFDWLVLHVVTPVAVPFTLLLIGFEIAVTALVLWRGAAVRIALVAAMVFMVGLAPFMSVYELGNVPLLVWAALLLRRDYPRTLPGLLTHRADVPSV
ncbi:hypothetical protein MF672_001290 [Actinomadura sp. ATCC 31491]|uniref:DoxX family protein n=1 Tax=Actinomadura luzonensis TaxID=2805427 RepID=A0ABT0FJF5_9ACTN|nr:hypothetical protein [Actinomadura luzonensis]MCK2212439.1 hypothetical protein [Actinomadura luzonensis]